MRSISRTTGVGFFVSILAVLVVCGASSADAAVRVLAYKQYADTSREYPNTLAAMASTGMDYELTELSDYTQLSANLSGEDVFLIPEQEQGAPSASAIGSAWASYLQAFVAGGGRIVVCSHHSSTIEVDILVAAGLLSYTASDDFYGSNVDVVAPGHPLAEGVSASYRAENGSRWLQAADCTAVVEYAGNGPVVLVKQVGLGQIVIIGHDYYDSNADQDRILANAVFNRLAPCDLTVAPVEGAADFEWQAFEWGWSDSLDGAAKSYNVSNAGSDIVTWQATADAGWLVAEPNSGVLAPGESVVVTLSFGEIAATFLEGGYTASMAFNYTGGNCGSAISATLDIRKVTGLLVVADTIEPVEDHNVPLGDVMVGSSRGAQVVLSNADTEYELAISEIVAAPLFGGFYEDFESGTLDSEKWPSVNGSVSINDIGINEVSGSLSLNLDGTKSIDSKVIDLSRQRGLVLSLWYQRRGGGGSPEGNDDLLCEYLDVSGSWLEIPGTRQKGDGPDMTSYEQIVVPLPDGAYHAGFRLRVMSVCSSTADDWFVDDVAIMREGAGTGGGTVTDGIAVTIPGEAPWVLGPGEQMLLDVDFSPTQLGEYEWMVLVASDSRVDPNVEVRITGLCIADTLEVTPEGEIISMGHPGGPLRPSEIYYDLTAYGDSDVEWAVSADVNWLDISSAGGSLAAHESAGVEVSLNEGADVLAEGMHTATVRFSNLSSGSTHDRLVTVNVYTAAKVWIDPIAFDVTLYQGGTTSQTLSIGNRGDSDLDYVISTDGGGATGGGGTGGGGTGGGTRSVVLPGYEWLELSQDSDTVSPGGVSRVDLTFRGNTTPGTKNLVLYLSTNDPQVPVISVPIRASILQPELLTELFGIANPLYPGDPNANDVSHCSLTFIPDETRNGYRCYCSGASAYPVDPAGGEIIALDDDDFVGMPLDGRQVSLFGRAYDMFYVCSNGTVTFGQGDLSRMESFSGHCSMPRISGLFDDLDPSSGGEISCKQLDDRIVVTFDEVPEFGANNMNNFQIEMFDCGAIRITYLLIMAKDGLVGLSRGEGHPYPVVETDFSEQYESCFAGDHPQADTWIRAGGPECWCYPRQCHGDADGFSEGGKYSGQFYVHFADLNTLLEAWNVAEAPVGPGVASGPGKVPGICADFDHKIEGGVKTGFFRVHFNDLTTLVNNWSISEEPDGPGIAGDCGGSVVPAIPPAPGPIR